MSHLVLFLAILFELVFALLLRVSNTIITFLPSVGCVIIFCVGVMTVVKFL